MCYLQGLLITFLHPHLILSLLPWDGQDLANTAVFLKYSGLKHFADSAEHFRLDTVISYGFTLPQGTKETFSQAENNSEIILWVTT